MTPERWQQIEPILQGALDLAPEYRSAFLDRACAGDESLRREVEGFIASDEQAGSFIESTAMAASARALAEEAPESMAGKSIGHYRILQQLGAGGMGEVYVAIDTRTDRKVALKLLPSLFTQDVQRVRRFQQEARTVLGLNHPNIVTIYEIGQAGETHFIASELVEGETLRQRMLSSESNLNESLDVTIQAAAALASAHGAGIVHRDIKPENIMIRRDGYVKVLDFGLAKLVEQTASSESAVFDASTQVLIKTDPGLIMGTAVYMSPEQARGLEIDVRTDIWSLGVVLYETIAGRRPFGGETNSDVLVSILEKEPAPITRYAVESPNELQWIIKKALRKDRDERYQTMKELLSDLRALKQQLEVAAHVEQSASATAGEIETQRSDSGLATPQTGAATPATADVAPLRTISSAEYLIIEARRHKGFLVTLALIILVVTGVGVALYKFKGPNQALPFASMQIVRVTTTGKVSEAAISPDGKYIVYVIADATGQSIWVRHIVTSSNVQIVPATEAGLGGVTFTPDGNYVYYVRQEAAAPANLLYQIPVLGGSTPKKIAERVHGAITFSPDGKLIAFARWRPGRGDGPRSQKLLIVMDAEGGGERQLAAHWTPEVFINSAWSPNGKVIVVTVENASDGSTSVREVQVADGTEKVLSAVRWFNAGRLAWLADGTGLILPASDKPSGPPQIWHLSYPAAEARKITNDLNGYNHVSLTADSRSLVTVQSDESSNIWIVPGGDASRAKQITSGAGKYGAGDFVSSPAGLGRADGGGGIAWTPDGRLVYHSLASGKLDIWLMDADGSNQKQLTSDAGSNYHPSVCGDGRYIVFQSDRAGSLNIWRMDLDGGSPKQLSDNSGQIPNCSPDGKWVAYALYVGGIGSMWRVPIDGGAATLVSKVNDVAQYPVFSPDGKLLACNYIPPGSDWQLRIAALSFETGEALKVFEVRTLDVRRELRWTADGRAITYFETHKSISNIWSQSLGGEAPKQLTSFAADQIFSFAWSRDGRLAVARGSVTSDVVLISSK
jgi:serine/threonine protein kinase/Tol biopolymer transport system component